MDKDTTEFEANFSVLERYGTDVTKEEYVTDPAIGRDQQIKELILVLLTPEKSAILIGKPGIGKTAIVEGLAYRIQKNDVPEALQGYTIVNIKTASLLGTMPSGESKVQKMIDELKTKEKMILFIDEIHMLIGSTETSSLDFANIFKEGLGRGSIKVIGATTTEEYERYILRDKAFTRRFQKIDVPEPTREETIKIMMGTLPKFEKQTGRKMKYTPFIQERIMSFIVDITSEYKRIFSLGSRYPDVCLTLLKQAFSFTVYDNRPYTDIFDVRKAIENSKNIYPDVIKKELPNFDKMFNDIMLEEKGEKPVEEWRKDGTLTRNEIDNASSDSEEDSGSAVEKAMSNSNAAIIGRATKKNVEDESEKNISVLTNVPEMIDRIEARNNKPVNSIIDSRGKTKFAKVGSAAVSTGLKEKLNKTTNSKSLDDMLLSSEISTLKREQPKDRVITNFVVTDEIRPGVDDKFLLGRPIESNMMQNEVQQEDPVIAKYRMGNQNNKKNEGRRMWNNDYRPNRQDINSQNFDKYQNYFHPENNMNGQNQENDNRMDMLMSGANISSPNNMGNNMNQMGPPMDNQMYGPMNQMGPQMNNQMYGPMNQMPPQMDNQMYGPMNPMGPQMNNQMYGPMNQMGPQMDNQMYGPMNPMGPQMSNQMYGPMNQMPPQMNNQMGPQMDNQMYGPMNQMPPQMDPIQNNSQNNFNMNMNNELNKQQNSDVKLNSFDKNETLFGVPMYDNNSSKNSDEETLFGAPMYSDNNLKQEKEEKTVDIYGQLLADNMSLKNGEIVNEFPTFEKLDNLSNITNSMKEQEEQQANADLMGNLMGTPQMAQPMNQMGPQMNNQMYGPMNGPMNNQMGPQMGYNNMPNNQMNQNKNWTFLDGAQGNMQQENKMNNKPSLFQKNILDDVPKNKPENNISPNENVTAPTSNKDYYEDMKSGDFVNFSDLNSGKVKEEETNKYMGVQVSEDKPQFDLNIEGNSEEEDKFDDFYE